MLNLSIPSSKPRNSADGVFFQHLYLHITPVTSCPRWKGMLISLMYWKHVSASFCRLPHFLFPWLVSIIQAPFLNWNFPCSCILTCCVVQCFLFEHTAPKIQFSGLSQFFYPSGKLLSTALTPCFSQISLCSVTIATGSIAGGCCLMHHVLWEKSGLQQSGGKWQGQIPLFKT